MNIKKHASIIMELVLACGLVSCFNDTAFDVITTPHLLDTLLYLITPPSGAALSATTVLSSTDESVFNSVAAGSDGIYAAGHIHGTGTYDFNNGVVVTGATSADNAVLVKYDLKGKAQWAKTVYTGATNASEFNSVAVGSDGVYAAGRINNTSSFNFGTAADPKTVNGTCSGPYTNIVLVKYDFDGTTQWAVSLCPGTTTDISKYNSVAVVGTAVYAAGIINGTSEFDFGTSINPQKATGKYGDINIVIVKYGSDGTTQWAKTVAAGPNRSEYNSVAAGSDGIYATGYIIGSGTYDFGNSKTVVGKYQYQIDPTLLPDPNIPSNLAGNNIVVVKYDTEGVAQWATTVTTGPNNSEFKSIAVGTDGSVYAAGYIYGDQKYYFGGAAEDGPYNNGNNSILVKYNPLDGTAAWAKAGSYAADDSGFRSVSVDSNGVYVAGYITGTSKFEYNNDITVSGVSSKNIIVMKYGFFGVPQWATTVSQGFISQYNSVSAGSDGIYTAGYIQENAKKTTFNFGYFVKATGPFTGENAVLVKYKP